MWQRVYNICAAISLGLCLSTLALAVLARDSRDISIFESKHPFFAVEVSDGQLIFGMGDRADPNVSSHSIYFYSFMLLSLAVAFRLRRFKVNPEKLGCCRKCGYDLRGSRARCPECGTPFTQLVPVPREFVEEVAGLEFPIAADDRLNQLLEREKVGTLTADETAQLKALDELGAAFARVRTQAMRVLPGSNSQGGSVSERKSREPMSA